MPKKSYKKHYQKTKKTKGIVEKINIKKAIVTLPQGRYNVPLSMLEAC